MRRFSILLLSALLIFAFTTVSMANPTIKGDFRYNIYKDETKDDENYAQSDLRVSIEDDLSDSLHVFAKFRVKNETDKDNGEMYADEYYVKYKESWGSIKAGHYGYKFTPSRVLLKSAEYHEFPSVDIMAATTFNTSVDGLTFDVLYQPYADDEEEEIGAGAYGLTADYNAGNWGAKISYADLAKPAAGSSSSSDADLLALDVYYKLDNGMKFFVNAVDYSANDKKYSRYGSKGIDGIDPVLGFQWKKVAGSKFDVSAEYAINPRFEDTDAEYNGLALGAKYQITKNTKLEFEHYVKSDDETKTMGRIRYKF